MNAWQTAALYLSGWFCCMLLGMSIASARWKKRYREAKNKAYQRGWEAGFGFRNRIVKERIEVGSSVKVIEHKQEAGY